MAYVSVPLAQAADAEAAARRVDPSSAGVTFSVPLYGPLGTQTHVGCAWAVTDQRWEALAAEVAVISGAEIGDGFPPSLMTASFLAIAASLRERASSALTSNAAYLSLSSPTAAQTTAQAKSLTRQASGLIRLMLGKLDALD